MFSTLSKKLRPKDGARHCGMPVAIACFILAFVTGCMQAGGLASIARFLPLLLTIYPLATGLVGILAALTGARFLTILYLPAQLSFFIANINYYSKHILHSLIFQAGCNILGVGTAVYLIMIAWNPYLVLADVFAWFSVPFSLVTLAGFRKLLIQQGASVNVIISGRFPVTDEYIVEPQYQQNDVRPVSVLQPQVFTIDQPRTVITVASSPAQIIIETNPSVYPQLHAAPYGIAVVHQLQVEKEV